MKRLPVHVCLVGASGSGKTSLIEHLLPALCARGLAVGYLKANAHRIDLDREGKDTARARLAGARVALVHSRSEAAILLDPPGPEVPGHDPVDLEADREALDHAVRARLWNLASVFHACDLVLVEGMKASSLPKIVLESEDGLRARPEHGTTPLRLEALRGVAARITLPRPATEDDWRRASQASLRVIEALLEDRRQAEGVIGAVLAGGASRRMGRDKAQLPIEAHLSDQAAGTWLERAFLLLAERLPETWIVGRVVGAGSPTLPLLTREPWCHLDLVAQVGPLGGLFTALTLAGDRDLVAIPCDLPYLSPRVLELLLAEDQEAAPPHRPGRAKARAFRHADGRTEPAVLLLSASAREPLQRFLDQGGRKLEAFLREIGVEWIDLPADLSPGFRNMNRPDDLRA
ncbi:MAG: molybdopterin-guanine dinucleotide biosynthesis protein MobB [Candidatus Eisenbacteria bacterium]